MKAIVYTQYGSPDVLHLASIEKPVPAEGQILVQIYAASLNAADRYLLRGQPFMFRAESGLKRPRRTVLGADIAGRVEAVGPGVSAFRPGDEVYGDLSGCGLGGFAEYVAVPENIMATKPANLSWEQAAAVPMAAVTALQGLRKGQIQAGQKVLIHGASGGVGTFAVQIARELGAHVTAVCSARKAAQARELGAERIIDYQTTDFAREDVRYDLIFAVNGDRSVFEYRRALRPGGRCIVAGGSMRQIFQAMLLGPLLARFDDRRVGNLLAQPSQDDLTLLAEWLGSGRLVPLIDRCYTLDEVPQAMHDFETSATHGKIIIVMPRASA